MSRLETGVLALLALILVITIDLAAGGIANNSNKNDACIAKGGLTVRTYSGDLCLKVEELK